MGEGSAGTRVAVGKLGRRVGVVAAIKGVAEGDGVGTAVEVDDAIGDRGTLAGVDSGDARVAEGDGAPGVCVAVEAATSSLDVAVASGLLLRVVVAGRLMGWGGVGAGSGGNTAHAASVTLSKMTSRLWSLGAIHFSGSSNRLDTMSVNQGNAAAAAASIPHPGGMIKRRRGWRMSQAMRSAT